MIYQYSLIHLLFVLVLTLVWRMIDRKFDFKNYLVITLVVGWVGTFGYDFLGVFVYRFWGYYSQNVPEYLVIAACTYVIAAPLLIETIGYILQRLSKFRLGFRYTPSRVVSACIFVLAAGITLLLTGLRYFELASPGWGYFLLLAVSGVTALDQFVFILRGVKGPISLALEGRVLGILAVPISGLVCGLLWEVLNLQFPLWYHQNLPAEKVLGVPLVVILFWGMLNMGYWTLANLLFPQSKAK